MVFKKESSGDGAISNNSQNWNVAEIFTKIKIMKLLIDLDIQEKVASCGRVNQEEQVMPEEIPNRRVEALQSVIFLLTQLLGNCKFAIKEKKDKELLNILFERIEQVENVMPEISQTIVNDVTKENILEINENHFKKCTNVLRDIKNELNTILDHASLIFRHSDEIDLDDITSGIIEGG